MNDRRSIEQELDRIEQTIRELDMAYEKYFMGIERRPPEQGREELGRVLRRLANRHLAQTDLRFRFQMLSTRYHNYCANWDRLMKNIENGKFVRQLQKIRSAGGGTLGGSRSPQTEATPRNEADRIYEQLAAQGGAVDRQQVATFLEKQRAALSQKLGGREVEFIVVSEDGKPKIKARPKN